MNNPSSIKITNTLQTKITISRYRATIRDLADMTADFADNIMDYSDDETYSIRHRAYIDRIGPFSGLFMGRGIKYKSSIPKNI